MSLAVHTAAATPAVSLDEAKAQLRVTTTDEDALIARLVAVAADLVQQRTGRVLIDTVLEESFRGFLPPRHHHPAEAAARYSRCGMRLARGPVSAIVEVAYLDGDGVAQTLDPAAYRLVDPFHAGELEPAHGQTWPAIAELTDAVTVRYTAGYGAAAADVPEALRHALLLLVGHYFEHREAVTMGPAAELPLAVADLLAAYATVEVG